MSESQGAVRVDQDGAVAVVTLDRPPMNALDLTTCEELTEAFARLGADPGVRGLVLTAAGRAFSAGIDLQLLPDLDPAGQDVLLGTLNRMFAVIYGSRLPVVAAVGGHAIAGGLVLATCCDHTVAGPRGKHGLTEVAVGVRFPAVAAEVVTAELPPATVRRLVLDGATLDSEEAVGLGVYDALAEDPLPRAVEVATARAAHDPVTYGDLKQGIRAPALARIATVLADGDPLEGAWLSPEVRERARAQLAR